MTYAQILKVKGRCHGNLRKPVLAYEKSLAEAYNYTALTVGIHKKYIVYICLISVGCRAHHSLTIKSKMMPGWFGRFQKVQLIATLQCVYVCVYDFSFVYKFSLTRLHCQGHKAGAGYTIVFPPPAFINCEIERNTTVFIVFCSFVQVLLLVV